QILTLLLLLFPPSNTIANPASPTSPSPDFHEPLFHLLRHFLSITDTAAAAISFLSISKKRKRAHSQEPDDPGNDTGSGSRLDRLGSAVPRNPDSFKLLFRMKASTFEWLCGLLEPLLECRDPAGSPLSLTASTRLGIGLFRLSTGAKYAEISTRFGVSEADSRFCVKHLCRVLCTNYRFWVGFPSHAELDPVSTRFETLTGLPNCCGIISCTRFTLEKSNGSDSITDSIAAQVVVAGFHGNKTDLQILKSSTLYKDIEKGAILDSNEQIDVNEVKVPQFLLGNGDYPLLSWLLVPFRDPRSGSAEENFNNVHRSMSLSSLKAVASLRSWGVLSRLVETDRKVVVACIGACSILHNMLIAREDYSAFCDDELDDNASDNRSKSSLEGDLSDEKAFVIRKALACRAKN
ncbi:putative nuclease harbi1, partial [Phtheirospermum japonicum]